MKKFLTFILITLLALFMVACGDTDKDSASDDNKGTDKEKEESTETIKVEHELDTTEVKKNPKNVVVFDYGLLDTLDKLDVDVAGVAQSSNIPKYLDKYTSEDYANIGSLKEPDFEKIAEIAPELILITGRQTEVYEELSEIAPTVYLGVDPARYMDSFKENMEVIGEIFDKTSEVETAINDIEESIVTLKEKSKDMDEKALVILSNDDKISAYGPKSRFGLIHDVFGVKPVDEKIEASTHGMSVSFEYVVENDPDILYVVDRSAVVDGESSAKQVVENKLVEKTKAYKNDRIVYLNPEIWYLSGGGLISVEMMVDEIAESLEK
ncbi:siderophore ABC transporter substrate-binding protein [Cerasibacillus terrae]|uniref:Siderophore ABC transporter substrate-binding protein n=1 Tax=Cerasibacillus terrae TaxID=2498845 RepID=A0A5C8NLH0_9BACI|nr:siderophore ABC transporter substrate-binding protein [Cerasibacillus terrae]TXL61745.1 siderophore ABC transporter substrate-binding protein [Cerasibacillus terrae]